MPLNRHSRLEGLHATLSASSNAWTNYDLDKMRNTYAAKLAADHGTRLHAFAKMAIDLKQIMPDDQLTLNMYINDCIRHRMHSEQILYYSDNAFGTADAMSARDGLLRIFDLKTGITATSFKQLEVYAAFFCLEYKEDPFKWEMEFRIYQSDDRKVVAGDPIVIKNIMEQIVLFDKEIAKMRIEAGL